MRTWLVAAVAAVVGAAGGAGVAVYKSQKPASIPVSKPSNSPSSTPKSSPTSTPTTRKLPTLLYFSNGEIHDGDTVVKVPNLSRVSSLSQIGGSYLLAEPVPGPGKFAYSDLWSVTPDGAARRVARIVGRYDVNSARTRVVAIARKTGKITIFSPFNGLPVATFPGTSGPTDPTFVGSDVAVTDVSTTPTSLSLWDPATGSVTRIGRGLRGLASSPGGSYIAGTTGGLKGDRGCIALRSTPLTATKINWRSCALTELGRGIQFSPDGTKVLAVPSNTDGFGPVRVDVLSVTDGPKKPVSSFDLPAHAFSAGWADTGNIWIYGNDQDDPSFAAGGWVDSCDINTHRCVRTADLKSPFTVGGGIY